MMLHKWRELAQSLWLGKLWPHSTHFVTKILLPIVTRPGNNKALFRVIAIDRVSMNLTVGTSTGSLPIDGRSDTK